ncbi:MAG: LysE family translocator [Betaproteobacteria bacterium]|nr:MAG: LysE family translocator [Betaproteobacteria bacterium]
MYGIHDFGVFLAAAVLLNLTPGQDTLYIVGRSLAEGRSAGIAAALGICAGALVHTLAAAVSVSAILATSATAFLALKLAGAAYLVYLGVALWRARPPLREPESHTRRAGAAIAFRRGVLTNVTNPKVALFFLAFLPQFIAPESTSKIAAFVLLGFTFVATSTVWCLVLAFAATCIRDAVLPRTRSTTMLSRAAGALFVALGIRLAVSEA